MNIVFENEQFLVVDKPSGLVVNKSETAREQTLQDQIAKYFKLTSDNLGIGGRAGIVHRLDRETSGLLVVAKTEASFENLQSQFAARQVKKGYLVLVHGKVSQDHGAIEVKIRRIGKFGKFGVLKKHEVGGRETETEYDLQKRYLLDDEKFNELLIGSFTKSRVNYLKVHAKNYSFLKVFPKTGRTHQIRVALKYIGSPVVCDLIYAPAKLLKFDKMWCPRLFLHSAGISFSDPNSGRELNFKSKLPQDLKKALTCLTIDTFTIDN